MEFMMYAGEINILSREDDLSNFIKILKESSIELGQFQTWDDEKCSLFIESCLVRIPIPPFMIKYNEMDSISIICGRNRWLAITRFMNDEFALTGNRYQNSFENKKWSELPRNKQRMILETSITWYSILEGVPDDVVADIELRWG